MTRRVCGARGRLGGHAPKFETRSIMVSSMGGNVVGDVVDGNVVSKAGDVGDNGRMTCGAEVFGGGVEVSLVEQPRARPSSQPPLHSPARPSRPQPYPLPSLSLNIRSNAS